MRNTQFNNHSQRPQYATFNNGYNKWRKFN